MGPSSYVCRSYRGKTGRGGGLFVNPEVFCKKEVLKNFSKFHRKTPVPESLIFPYSVQMQENKRLRHTCFPVNFAYRTPLVAASVELEHWSETS